MRKTAVFLMVIMAVFILGEFNHAMSATFTVTNTNDSGAGSLRQAIIGANGNVDPSNTINFSVTGTITLTTGELLINKNLTITGPGAPNLTISGNNASRVFNVSSGVTFDLSNVTVANGHTSDGSSGGSFGGPGDDGGGILNAGTLTVTNSTFSGNATGAGGSGSSMGGDGGNGGGIYNSGTLTVTNSTFSGNTTGAGGSGGSFGGYGGSGGGILNAGTLTVTNSTFSGNTTGAGSSGGTSGGGGGIGGGICNWEGTLTVTNSTFSGNATGAGNSGSSFCGDGGDGGGIYSFDSTLTVTNSTFSGNTTGAGSSGGTFGGDGGNGGGIYNLEGTLTVTSSTFSGNATGAGGSGSIDGSAGRGGGIYSDTGSTVSLRNTIVANSISGENCFGSITSLGHNLDSSDTCAFAAAGDLINTDPLLGPLALNAPGATQTHALLVGSLAIDAGDNSGLPLTDQRGAIRIWDGDENGSAIVDIGAYEYGAPLYEPTTIPTLTEIGMIIFMLIAGLVSIYSLSRKRRVKV